MVVHLSKYTSKLNPQNHTRLLNFYATFSQTLQVFNLKLKLTPNSYKINPSHLRYPQEQSPYRSPLSKHKNNKFQFPLVISLLTPYLTLIAPLALSCFSTFNASFITSCKEKNGWRFTTFGISYFNPLRDLAMICSFGSLNSPFNINWSNSTMQSLHSYLFVLDY